VVADGLHETGKLLVLDVDAVLGGGVGATDDILTVLAQGCDGICHEVGVGDGMAGIAPAVRAEDVF